LKRSSRRREPPPTWTTSRATDRPSAQAKNQQPSLLDQPSARHFEYADDDSRVNPSGGAIALGHPIGASGVIYFSEMCHELNARDGRWGLQRICGGGGIGIATVVEREDS
jgi:hypothetical protein